MKTAANTSKVTFGCTKQPWKFFENINANNFFYVKKVQNNYLEKNGQR